MLYRALHKTLGALVSTLSHTLCPFRCNRQAFIVPVILKYIDNIADLYAHAGAVLITAFCSWLFFDLHPNMFFMLGMLASVCSLFLYYSERLSPELAARFEAAVDSATSRLRDGELGYGALAIVKKPSKELEA